MMTSRIMVIALALSIAVVTHSALAYPVSQCENRPGRPQPTPGETSVVNRLSVLRQCTASSDDRTACNVFLGRALEILFNNTDFKTADGYMLANDIANGLSVPGNAGWTRIGLATDQTSLNKSQELANSGKPVVAARKGLSGHAGHVVLIIPGTAQKYDFDDVVNGSSVAFSWGNLVTPNSASFFLDRPDKFFLACPLSATWRKPDGVGLYFKP